MSDTIRMYTTVKKCELRIREINVKKSRLIRELDNIHKKLKVYDNELDEINKIRQNIIKQNNKSISYENITDHAIIRYIERILKIDLDKVRKNILTRSIISTYSTIGDGKYKVTNNDLIDDKTNEPVKYNVVIHNGKVVTITNKEFNNDKKN